MSDIWFEDLDGNPVEPGTRPVAKNFVIDPNRELEVEWILYVLDPFPWEQVIRTNADQMEALAAFSGAMPSRGQARKNGFSGPIPHGLEMYGTKALSFWCWNAFPQPSKPTIGKKKVLTSHWFAFCDMMGWTNR